MKLCNICDEIKSPEEFRKRKSKRGYILDSYCKICRREYMMERYRRLRKEYIELLGGECVSCGTVENLHFDHIDCNDKAITVGQLLNFSKEKVLAELEKCQLLCAQCHTEKSREEGDFWKRKERARHGTIHYYQYYKCRCDPCREAINKYNREWKREKKRKLSGRSRKTP